MLNFKRAQLLPGLLFLTLLSSPAQAYPSEADARARLPFANGLLVANGAIHDRGRSMPDLIASSARLDRLVSPVAGLDERRQIAFVQSIVGELIAYRRDDILWGRSDHWASAKETLARRAGDCEDIALLKLAALSSLGVPRDRLALIVGTDSVRGDHAIAAVRSGGQWLMLDDDGIVRRDAPKRFKPIYTLVGQTAFLHGVNRSVRPAAN
ncbi:transglutaminase-like cysteine peptidase [Sphingomicrobium clamense]|uniref:Transglutaminase-like cysteine peptidase n=1 Tax=Sphingomicrobium clamense TaxID=2851013 RepID=A0ABS6V394_9SPHN|nr:transglutaminase-like cysteine peptidase [Sphingomicrobium sp. B8]